MRELIVMLFSLLRPLTMLRWGIYVFAAAVVWLIFDYPMLQTYMQARSQRDHYRQQVAQELAQKERLRVEHEALKKGGFPAEKAIRERQQMRRPGEKVLIIETPAPNMKSDPKQHPGQ